MNDMGATPRLGSVALIGLLVAALTVLAPASSEARTSKVKDSSGDVIDPGPRPAADYDIVKATAKSKRNKRRIKHVIKVRGNAANGEHGSPGSAVRVEIDAKGKRKGDCNGLSVDPRTDYILSDEADGMVIDCTGSGIPTSKKAKVKARGSKVIFKFGKGKIDNPRKYRWAARSGPSSDFAPDPSLDEHRLNYVKHKLKGSGKGKRNRWRSCGDLQQQGAGAYDIRAKRTGCRQAKKVARHWRDGGWMNPGKKWRGWRCSSKQTGPETSKVKCTKRKQGHKKKVKFGFGA